MDGFAQADFQLSTASTGNNVIEATIPGKCAAPPAPAIIMSLSLHVPGSDSSALTTRKNFFKT